MTYGKIMKTSIANLTSKGLITVLIFSLFLGAVNEVTAQDKAGGTLNYKGKSKTFNAAIKYVYLVEGATDLNPSEPIRRLLFSTVDLGSKIKSASTMRETDTSLKEGFEIDLVKGPRYNYWMVLNNGLVQYSGTVPPENLVLTVNSPTQLMGTFKQDNSEAGGPKIDVTFEVTLLKKFEK